MHSSISCSQEPLIIHISILSVIFEKTFHFNGSFIFYEIGGRAGGIFLNCYLKVV